MVSKEKSDIILIFLLSQVRCFPHLPGFLQNHFSLSWIFCSWKMTVEIWFLIFILLRIFWDSWICGLVLALIWKKFYVIIASDFSSVLFSFCSPADIPIICMLYFMLVVSWFLTILFNFFAVFFLFFFLSIFLVLNVFVMVSSSWDFFFPSQLYPVY